MSVVVSAWQIFSGSLASNTSVTVLSGGTTSNVQLLNVFNQEYVFFGGGLAVSAVVAANARQLVDAGGSSFATQLAGGEVVFSGGIADSTKVRGELTVSSGGIASGTVVSSGGTLMFGAGAMVSGTDILVGGTVDFATEGTATSASVVFSSVSDVLTLTEGTAQFFATLSEPYVEGGEVFSATVTNGGSDVLVMLSSAPCFRRGSRVLTDQGQVAVEDLRIGDGVVTVAGAVMPVRWIGHRRVDCRRHKVPEKVWPVRVMADAFEDGVPARDVFLSPDHAVFVDEVLIPIGALVNGTTICQVVVDCVEYFHVELERHEVMLAEGLACESFLDSGNRWGFENGGAAVALHPDFVAASWDLACAELVMYGPRVEAVRERVEARVGKGRDSLKEAVLF